MGWTGEASISIHDAHAQERERLYALPSVRKEVALSVAERIRATGETTPIETSAGLLAITVSIGGASACLGVQGLDTLSSRPIPPCSPPSSESTTA